MGPLIVLVAFIFILLHSFIDVDFFTPSLTAVMTLTWWSIIIQNKHNLCTSLFFFSLQFLEEATFLLLRYTLRFSVFCGW